MYYVIHCFKSIVYYVYSICKWYPIVLKYIIHLLLNFLVECKYPATFLGGKSTGACDLIVGQI